MVAARYTSTIKYQPTDLTKIATVVEGSAGLTGGGKETAKPEEKKAEEKKRDSASAASRSPRPAARTSSRSRLQEALEDSVADRLAKGGDNPNPVKVAISPADVAAFKKGIA